MELIIKDLTTTLISDFNSFIVNFGHIDHPFSIQSDHVISV